MHPRFDLRLLNNLGGRTSSHVFKESPAATILLSHGGVSGRGRQHDARYVTIQTWKVLPLSAERVPPDFSYVNLRLNVTLPDSTFDR